MRHPEGSLVGVLGVDAVEQWCAPVVVVAHGVRPAGVALLMSCPPSRMTSPAWICLVANSPWPSMVDAAA